MAWVWNPWGVTIVALALLDVAAAAFVYAARPRRYQNRLLATVLFAEGLAWGLVGIGFFTDDPGLFFSFFATEQVAWLLTMTLYLAFLGTIPTPWSRPLGTRTARGILGLGFVAGTAAFLVETEMFWTDVVPGVVSPWYAYGVYGFWFWILTAVASFYGLVVGVSYVRHTRAGTMARSQAKAYLAAFFFRDIPYVIALTLSLLALGGWGGTTWVVWIFGEAAFVLLLAYGMLKTQLFDIDLKIKRTVKQTAVVTALAGVYVATSIGARMVLPAPTAQTVGVVITGMALFALLPLQRMGQRVADAALPRVHDDDVYLDQRRFAVYQAAVEDVVDGDGTIPQPESGRLARLRAELGITDRDHEVLLHALQHAGRPARAPVFEPGRKVLGRYHIEACLGSGGQGSTYHALDSSLGREVVIKAFHGQEPRALLKEARALARIDHPQVVRVHDVEAIGDQVWLVMEHIEGGALRDRIGRGPLEPRVFRRVAHDLMAGLEAVHRAGLVHRDVKPGNVLLTLDGRAKLADLGLATEDTDADETASAGADGAGTVAYMSPEQAKGLRPATASDRFSAALTLYEAYTGRPLITPRIGETGVELRARIAAWDGFDGTVDDPGLDAWFRTALAPQPEDRFSDTAAMRHALVDAVGAPASAHTDPPATGDDVPSVERGGVSPV